MNTTTRTGRIARLARLGAFAYLSGTIAAVASERVYWYWGGATLDSLMGIGVFYALPMMAGLWALALTPARRIHQVILASAVFAFVVEGVLTAVIYQDGALPVMAAMFVGWHGMLSFVAFWYLARTWLVEGRTRALAWGAAAVGSGWGLWAITSSLGAAPEDLAADGITGTVLDPGQFFGYALAVGAILVAAHLMIGRVWPTGWRPGRRATWILAAVTVTYMAAAVLPFVAWAPVKLAVLIGGTTWLLRRSRPGIDPAEPTVLDRLGGSVRLRDAGVLMVMPVCAAMVYAIVWSASLSEVVLKTGAELLVFGQVAAGLAAYVWAARTALRTPHTGERDPAVQIAHGAG